MVHINLLPPEILALIFQPTYYKGLASEMPFTTIIAYVREPLSYAKAICLTCRTWLPYGRSLLFGYDKWTLLSKKSMKLVTALVDFPYLCHFVRALSIDSGIFCIQKYHLEEGSYERLGKSPPFDYLEKHCQLRLVLGVLQQCSSLENLLITGYLSDAPILEEVIKSLPKSVRRINIDFAAWASNGEDTGAFAPVWIETGKLLTLLRNQLPLLSTLSLEFGSECWIDISQDLSFSQLSVGHLSIGRLCNQYPAKNSEIAQVLDFFDLSAVSTLAVPMEVSVLTSLISKHDSLSRVADLTLLPTTASGSTRSVLAGSISALLLHFKGHTLDIQNWNHEYDIPVDFSLFMHSLPPTIILLKGLDTANHADSVADFWKTGKCRNLKRIEMRTWSEGKLEASVLQKAFSAKLRSESGFLDSPKYVGIVDVVPVLQELYPRSADLS